MNVPPLESNPPLIITHQLSDLQKALEGGVEDPTFKPMQDECNTELGKINGSLATLRKKLAELEQKLPQQFDTPALKFDPEKHPLLRKTVEKPEPAKPVVFNTGDICEVQWSGDKGWYKAKILSVMGSTADPKYTVRFLQYDETATVDKKSVRSIAKRKAEEPAVVNQPAKTAQIVISAPASVNPAAQAAAANDAGDAQPKVVKRRKIGGDKALDRKKNSWKQFQASTPQRESQFRVGTGINSRGRRFGRPAIFSR